MTRAAKQRGAPAAVLGVIARGRSDSRALWLGLGACVAPVLVPAMLVRGLRAHHPQDTDAARRDAA